MTDLIVDALATFRATRLLIADEITHTPRAALERYAIGKPGRPGAPEHPKLLYFMGCPWCVGLWLSVGVVVARKKIPTVWTPVATALALSAAAGVLSHHTEQ